jgi:Leucine-rich repeat (LRR) protein
LGSNNVSALPTLRLRLPKLEDLHLEHNRYESLPKNLGDLLPSLRDLYLANNSLHQLPPSLGGVATLRELHVEDNSLAELPAWCTRANLTHVDATNNLIVALPQLHDAFDTLEYLHLRGNPVNASTEALALELQRVPKLLSFDVTISTNQVYVGSQVPGFAACAKYDSYGIGKCWPHVDPPSQCNVGLPCTFRVQFYDANGVKIRSGGKLSGLSVRRAGADGRTRTTQLLDLRDGRFEGTIPGGLDWINHTASREFPFKDRGASMTVHVTSLV